MDKEKKASRYQRIFTQLEGLLQKEGDQWSKQATIAAVLYHKMESFFWCGFYTIRQGELLAGPYQGPVACQLLAKDNGVCWASVNQQKTLVVEDVEKFPGHIACDSRSRSEVVIPLKKKSGEIVGVLDVDSKDLASFDEVDALWLEKIVSLVKW